MKAAKRQKNETPSLLDVVALLKDLPAHGLLRGQVGTVVESFDAGIFAVEFCDDEGRGYALAPCPATDLLVLRYFPEAA